MQQGLIQNHPNALKNSEELYHRVGFGLPHTRISQRRSQTAARSPALQ
jgi:hypothetical protein